MCDGGKGGTGLCLPSSSAVTRGPYWAGPGAEENPTGVLNLSEQAGVEMELASPRVLMVAEGGGDLAAHWATLCQQALQQTELYCRALGLPFPRVELSPQDQQEPRECHLFSDPTCPEAPVLLHFPLVNASFKDHSAPGEMAPLPAASQPWLYPGPPRFCLGPLACCPL